MLIRVVWAMTVYLVLLQTSHNFTWLNRISVAQECDARDDE